MGTRGKSEKRIHDENWLAFWTTIGLDDPFHDVRTIRNLLLQEKREAVRAAESAESPDYETKGEEISVGEERISPWKVAFKLFRFPLIATFIFLIGISLWIFRSDFRRNQSVGMTKVEAALGKGIIEVPLDLVKKHKLVSFAYNGEDGPIPLLAYVTPSGRIVTAVGLSEPCNSKIFHLEGNEIVCNLCFTRWDLETLKGTSGECADHSMDILTHVVNKERLMLKEVDIRNWKPRLLRG